MEESVVVFRADATYLYVNAATERLYGKSREELLGRVFWDFFPETEGGTFHRVFLRVVETGRPEDFEHRYEVWGRWFRVRIYRGGELLYVFSRETTQERQNAEELAKTYAITEQLYEQARQAEQRAAFLARASELLASSLDKKEILRRLAGLAVPTLGDWCAVDEVSPEGEIQRLAVAHPQPEKIAQAYAFHAKYPVRLESPGGIGKVLRTGTTEFIPYISDELIDATVPDLQHRQDIRELGIRSILSVPLNSRGKTLAALTLVYGDGERRYTEADVRLAEDLARRAAASLDNGLLYQEAQEAIRARDAFLSIASHELNTPLTSLNLSIQTLLRTFERAGPLGPEVVRPKLQSVQRQVRRLGTLIHEMLDISRITAGKLRLEPEEVDLALLARELVARFSEELLRAGGELHLETPESVVGVWDPLRLEQVLQNLLSNAIKYGRGRPIALRIRAEAQQVQIVVRDQGIGISPEDQARLFQRFERVASERHYSGFGLGLWIVRQILDAMGGRIHVQSEPGQGSVFTVELPLRIR